MLSVCSSTIYSRNNHQKIMITSYMNRRLDHEQTKMAPQSGGQSARDVLEEIGGIIQQQAHNAAEQYHKVLQGDLLKVKFSRGGDLTTTNVCELNYIYDTNVTSGGGKENPCFGRQPVRFSDTKGAECYWNRIKGNDDKTSGACAPLRRLHLCDRNLEEIKTHQITSTHNLLLDVLLAAKHEGKSLVDKHEEYKKTHKDSNICTVLARSFADIGDIVRGKDLFLGHQQRKKKLEERLGKMFENIKENNDKLDKISIEQVREYWWALNRDQVWKAITCGAGNNDKYFRNSSNRVYLFSDGQCGRNEGKVPTNLDYVPQHLRWLQEWAEDFCTKRKVKLEDAIINCRGDEGKGEVKYCSSNGYDCEQTIRAIEQLRMGNDCIKCLLSCNPFRKWMDNQKVEFKKQKEKYTKEINERNENTKKDTKDGPINKIYAKQFYDELNTQYGSVDDFLELLNKETVCQVQPLVKNKGTSIDFKNEDDTFGPTEYCKPCPMCGVIKNGKTFKERSINDDACKKKNEVYKVPKGAKINEINVLYSGEGHEHITKKLSEFCWKPDHENGTKNEQWECYYQDAYNNKCKMKNNVAHDQEHSKIMTFYDFFNFWVGHLLNDAINWRTELTKCLSDIKLKKCKNMCKHNCKCFKKWIDKKEKEWEQVKNQFNRQGDINNGEHYTILETVLEYQFFPIIKKAYGELQSIEHMRQMIEEHKKNPTRTKDDEDAIDVLLDHEKEEAESCIDTHEKDKKCPEEHDDEEEEEEEIRHVNNPCIEPPGGSTTHPAMVNKLAHQMQEDAHTEASKRSGGISKLKADALKEPCDGKDGDRTMFTLEKGWKNGKEVNKENHELFMPPRRQHFCTSNLEYLETNDKPLNNNDGKLVNNSFLGDVLLSANKQAKWIKSKYMNQPDFKDNATICRAMKYSFADLGDIIKGTDWWDANKGEETTQNHLKDIFGTIKKKNSDIQEKYNNDDDKHTQLRKDWWEANRDQVWKAMQCALKSGNEIQCNNHTPIEDYIPQRLRWMTEWVEWFCKMQSQEYNKLVGECSQCLHRNMGKDCARGTAECTTCKQACDAYGEKIKKWKEQWTKIQQTYKILYLQAQTTARYGGIDAYSGAVDDKDKPVVQILQELLPPNSDKSGVPPSTPTPYSTAAGYIHQELPNVGCMKQEVFCDNNGNKGKYVFMDPPKGYEDACGCDKNVLKPPEKKEEIKKACEIVETLIAKNNDGNTAIGGCNPKHQGGSYPVWDCTNPILVTGKGECMPPRRIKLCLYYLKELSDTTQKGLREAFIKTAASETFFAWHYYNSKNANAQEQLKAGKIPPDFLRSMFYTFGDYRDICLDTDISAKHANGDVTKAKEKIDEIFPKGKTNDTERKEFWNKYAQNIWEAMLCALEKAGDDKVKFTDNPAYNYETVTFSGDNSHTLEEFTTRPQFLRWMTEWGEHFCREHKVEKGKLAAKCGDCAVDPDDGSKCDGECGECQEQCQAYKRWIKTWQDNYKKQKQRYTEVKDNPQYNNDNDVLGTTHAYEYLNKKLEKICQSEITSVNCEYKCMEQASSQNGKHMPESLDDTPNEYKDRCTCKDKEAPTPRPSDPPAKEEEQQEEACTIVDNIFKDEDDDYFKEACRQKYKGGKEIDTQWKCTTNKTKKGGQDEVCIPPRRQKLYVYNLTQLKDTSSQTELRRAFVQCAAIETFLAWHKYKMDKKQTQQQNGVGGLPLSVFGFGIGFDEEDTTIEEDPQEQLNGGDIPDQFKRQMFYTFGDYRDILFGKDVGNGNDIEEVKNKIKTVFQNSTDPDEQNDNEREKWWEQHGKDIWKGMVCVLSYDTDSKQIKQDVQDKLVGSKSGNKYDYTNVSFSGGFNSDKNAATITTKLEEFSRRPTFFRWLEEWGEEFCKKRTYKLKRIKDECRSDKYGKRYSSGDGEDCQNMLREDYNIVPDLEYPGCGKSCKSYKDWINTKKKEFKKHEEKYKMEISNNKSNSDNTYHIEFYKNIKTTNHTATQFLASLKEGSCCNNNNGENKINFNEQGEIFGHAKLCAPCPVFGVKRNKDDWINITDKTCKGKKFTEENIKNNKNRNEKVHMLVIDNSTKDFAEELEVCRDKGIFDGIRKDEWSCGYVCDVDICDLESVKEGMDDQKNIQIRAVLKQWLENFLKDYNKINDKISQCNKNGKESICINKCKNKCVCAEKWVDEKLKEWEKVKKRFFDQYHINDSQVYEVKSFLSKNIFSSGVQNILDEVKDSETLQKSAGCTNSASTKEQKCEKKDVITILIDRFKEKITSCKNQPDDGTHSNCDDSLEPLDPETPDEQPEEDPDTSTTSVVPHICEQFVAPEPQPPAPPAQDRTSEDASTEEKEEVPASPAPSEEVKPPEEVVPEKKGPPAPPKKPSTPRRRPREITRSILPEMVSISAFPLSVGIAFAALSYFLLKVIYKYIYVYIYGLLVCGMYMFYIYFIYI
ncbi:hypothetical protein PFMALIP_01458 [Plasmodium falciparum MaliPS096_E11]|uniref:Duffy-binding-like domain-containing protein n=1 Tax=Plasmodium falciparum MaliPS096_E11 TaxID=1036727 RepID=A0A024WTE2_PLAFA|nr:hypothetical protein PFMALIP_01458 [Plasmodium falciparum MaliPS096_E11]